MLTNWSTIKRKGEGKKRRCGKKLIEFQHGQVYNWYYYKHHAVDDNNNNRQGCLSFKEVFVPKEQEMKQFGLSSHFS